MDRRKFMIGAGSTAIGASTLVGSSAISLVGSKRTASVQTASDANAYIGLQTLDSNNSNQFVSTDGDNQLQINLDGESETGDGGQGLNTDSITVLNDLFTIVNQSPNSVSVGIYKEGDETDKIGFLSNGNQEAVWDNSLDIGDSVTVGLWAYTGGLTSGTQILEDIYIVAVSDGVEGSFSANAADMVPDSADADDSFDDANWNGMWDGTSANDGGGGGGGGDGDIPDEEEITDALEENT